MSRPRSSIGHDPLDLVLGSPPIRVQSNRSDQGDRKVRATFHLPVSLVEEARNATVALSGPPVRLTLARLVETAVRREIERLRDHHNQGQPFPVRAADLMGGRPIGT